MAPTAAYYTLGCKVNQYETDQVRQEMETQGFDTVPFSAAADVYVINTCTVTNIADSKSRHAIRQASRRGPDAFIVVTGCYAELEPQVVATVEGVDLVASNAEKEEIARRVLARFPDLRPATASAPIPRARTRATLKVQEGCDQFCAYCAVPFARSNKYSRLMDDVIQEAEALAGFGYKEIVLTGIRLGSYSSSNGASGVDLAALVERVSAIDGIHRLRLSSIEVWEITDKLVHYMAKLPTVCPHLHIPLQSGDDRTLQRMGRPYNTDTFRQNIAKARKAIPDLAVTTDVMVGFPGETDDEFSNTLEFVKDLAFSRLHVFRYSPRPRTRAARMSDHIRGSVKEQRSRKMIALGEQLAQQFAQSHVGSVIQVLAERKSASAGRLNGYTGNYIEVEFEAPASMAGEVVDVEATSATQGKLTGRLLSQ